MKSRVKPYLAALIAAAIVFGVVLFFERSEHKWISQELRADALQELHVVKSRLELVVNSRLRPAEGLSAYVSIHPEITKDEFNSFAQQIMERQAGILKIELVKGTVITDYIYPLEGNEAAIGLDLMTMLPEREGVLRAIETKKTVVAGPVDLIPGGVAFISRSPIFIASEKGSRQRDKYWGLAQVLITTDFLFKEAGLYEKMPAFLFAIRGKDAAGASGKVFFGDREIFQKDPVLLEVTIFSGSWQLAAVPVKGWTAVPNDFQLLKKGGVILSVLIGILAWVLVHNPIILKEKVVQAVKALIETEQAMQRLKDEIEATERRRLARELHDGVGQSLLALKLNLQMIKTNKIQATEPAIEEIIKDVSNTTGEIRDIVMDLRPPFLETDDIMKALGQLIERMQEKSGMRITLATEDNLTGLDYSLRYNIYRICQEVLNNVVKHSGADKTEIKFSVSDKELFLEIKDNGKGFDYKVAKERQRGSGLSIMAERAELLKGSFNLKTAPGEGTSIYITVPVA